MTPEAYKATFTEDDSPGWNAIDQACAKIYGEGEPFGHFGGLPPVAGGQGPDGVSVFRADRHLHYVSYGFSNLHYGEDYAGQEYSGKGFELSFRLRSDVTSKEDIPRWPISVFGNLYNYIMGSDRWFEPNQAIPTTSGPINSDISLEQSVITGLFCAEDPQLKTISTPHGSVQFILLVGMTLDEAEAFRAGDHEVESKLAALRESSPLLVTDMTRGLAFGP